MLDAAILLTLAYGWLQCVPLPGGLVGALQPASVEFHQTVNLGTFNASGWRPLSLAPAATREAMFNVSAAVAFYWTIRESSGRAGSRMLARAIALLGAAAVLLAVLQPILFPNGKMYGFWTPIYASARPVGPIISRNHFASWMILAAPITVGYLLTHARTYWVGSTTTKIGVRMLSDSRAVWVTACAILMVAGVLFSQSRAGLIGLSAAALVGIVGSRRHLGARARFALLVATLAFGTAAWMVANPSTGVLRRINTIDAGDWGGRPEIWRASVALAGKYLVAGVGVGAYEGAMPVYQPAPVDMFFNHAHNEYLQWLAETGLIGAGLAGLVGVAGFRLIARRHKRDRGPLVHLREGALGGIIGLAVQSLWETPLVTPALLWLLAASAALATERPASADAGGSRR